MSSMLGEDDDDRADPVPLGATVGGSYVTERVLGRGASGVVYAARAQDGAQVALKVIFAEHCHTRQIFERYKREAAILRRIGGEHIVRFLDFVEHDGLLAIALEHVEGSSLEQVLSGPLELERAVNLSLQVCAGLSAAHQAGVVHRDLKPANVMVEDSGTGERARILDFGLAKVVHGEHMLTGLTERDMIFGTPEYMAPEQARGDDVDARCDLYAVGVMLYRMTTGAFPHKGRTPLATMTAQLTEPVIAPRARAPERAVPPALEAVILRALEKDPEKRYASARALAEALGAALERRVIPVNIREHGEASISDTELALRRSQVHGPGSALQAAAQAAAAQAAAQAAEGPAPAAAASGRPWLWPAVTVVAIAACVLAGVLLALKG